MLNFALERKKIEIIKILDSRFNILTILGGTFKGLYSVIRSRFRIEGGGGF